MRHRIITEEFMLDNVENNDQYNNSQQYYIIDFTMDIESYTILRLHCKPENINRYEA